MGTPTLVLSERALGLIAAMVEDPLTRDLTLEVLHRPESGSLLAPLIQEALAWNPNRWPTPTRLAALRRWRSLLSLSTHTLFHVPVSAGDLDHHPSVDATQKEEPRTNETSRTSLTTTSASPHTSLLEIWLRPTEGPPTRPPLGDLLLQYVATSRPDGSGNGDGDGDGHTRSDPYGFSLAVVPPDLSTELHLVLDSVLVHLRDRHAVSRNGEIGRAHV